MSDGQEKSDDLIAELAKLMASGGASSEPENKPAPKLVSEKDRSAPAPVSVRIPGGDVPVSSSEDKGPSDGAVPLPTPQAPERPVAAQPAAAPPPARPSIRIPGMDQPAPAAPVQSAPPPVKTSSFDGPSRPGDGSGSSVSSAPAPKVPSFDFGKPPAAPAVAPEPMANWRDRETPKPAEFTTPSRPATAGPQSPSAPDVSNEARSSFARPVASERVEPSLGRNDDADHSSEADLDSGVRDQDPLVVAKPQPDDDSFDFDFGFGAPSPDEDGQSADHAEATAPDADDEVDPIADLISAELDQNETSQEPVIVPGPVRMPAAQPVQRDLPNASAEPVSPRAPVAGAGEPARAGLTSSPRVEPTPAARPGQAPDVSATPPAADRDPMDEIESLIGEAVRVELAAPERQTRSVEPKISTPRPTAAPRPVEPVIGAQTGAPVVPPLTTGFAPRRAAIKETESTVSSAEAAILAAAASAGAEVDRSEVRNRSTQAYRRPKAKPEQKRTASGGARQYIGMAVAGTLLLAAGLGLYWVFSMGGGPTDADAPVLSADATPTKEAPPPAAEPEATNSVVFDELDGVETTGEEQLVSRDGSEETSVADVARPVGDSEIGDSELANRKVRTVTVRPDGTIVSGDDALAGSEPLPVDRPTVPELPGADVQPSELLASIPDADTPPAEEFGSDDQLSSGSESLLAQPTDPANIDPSIVAPVPMPRPTDRSRLASGTATPVAAVSAPETSAPAATSAPLSVDAPATASGPYVQLSSQRTEGDAQASLRTLQSRLGGLLNGAQLQVRPVNLGSKGVWYRVVLPTGSFQQATQACATIKANGSDCVPING